MLDRRPFLSKVGGPEGPPLTTTISWVSMLDPSKAPVFIIIESLSFFASTNNFFCHIILTSHGFQSFQNQCDRSNEENT